MVKTGGTINEEAYERKERGRGEQELLRELKQAGSAALQLMGELASLLTLLCGCWDEQSLSKVHLFLPKGNLGAPERIC